MTETAPAWQALVSEPLHFVTPGTVGFCLDEALADDDLTALLGMPRFSQRLVERLQGYYGLAPLHSLPPANAADIAVLTLSSPALARLPLVCGALWHAAAVAREIRGGAVQALRQHVGADAYAFAVAHREQAAATGRLLGGEGLLAAIQADGQACLGAWLHGCPGPLQAWLRLRWPGWPPTPAAPCAAHLACVHSAAHWLQHPEAPAS